MKFRWLKFGALTASAALICGLILKKRTGNARQIESGDQQEGAETYEGQALAESIAEGIKNHAPVFDGLYEGLFQAARNQDFFSTDAYEEWCDRVEHLNDEPFYKAFAGIFSKSDIADEMLCREKYDCLLSCIAQAGILRERENGVTYTADEAMRLAYQVIDGSKFAPGAEYTVVKSAWTSGDNVIEYGMVMRKPEA